MMPSSFQIAFRELFSDCEAVLVERQKKYGPDNIPAFGCLGTLVRMNDKLERLKHLARRGSLEAGDMPDESVEDTLIDIANYATIMRAQLRGWWTTEYHLPLEEGK